MAHRPCLADRLFHLLKPAETLVSPQFIMSAFSSPVFPTDSSSDIIALYFQPRYYWAISDRILVRDAAFTIAAHSGSVHRPLLPTCHRR